MRRRAPRRLARRLLQDTFLLVALPTLLVTAPLIMSMLLRIPTLVEVDLTARHVDFTVGNSDSWPILSSANFQSLIIEKFDHIKFRSKQFEVADPAQYQQGDGQSRGRYPESAWKSLPVTSAVEISPDKNNRLLPKVTVEGVHSEVKSLGTLDGVVAGPGTQVVLEVKGARSILPTVSVTSGDSPAVLLIQGPFQLRTDYCQISGIERVPYQADSLTFRSQLPEEDYSIEVTSQSGSLVLSLTISPEQTLDDLFSSGAIAVTALKFTRQGPGGKQQTTLVRGKDGKIAYPNYRDISVESFKHPEFIKLEPQREFSIEELRLLPTDQGIQLRLVGIAKHIKTSSLTKAKDHRITLFTFILNDPYGVNVKMLILIISWVLGAIFTARRAYHDYIASP